MSVHSLLAGTQLFTYHESIHYHIPLRVYILCELAPIYLSPNCLLRIVGKVLTRIAARW